MDENKDDEAFLVVLPMYYAEAGITKGKKCVCSKCNTVAWLSDSTLEAVKLTMPDKPTTIICNDCLKTVMLTNSLEGKGTTIMGLTKEQIAEIDRMAEIYSIINKTRK